jgi:hypothetical protein
MASRESTFFTKQKNRDIVLHSDQSVRELVGTLRPVRIPYVVTGLEQSTDTIELCYPQIEGYLVPELSRISNTGAGTVTLSACTIRKVNPAGTATALTAAAATVNDSSVALARPTGMVVPILEKPDYLQALITVTAVAAGDILVFELMFAVFKND